ncbi:MAG: ComF family protein [Proteobacteria bacterium]|nr:ComF family protein [Pseudomonadota bacterium]
MKPRIEDRSMLRRIARVFKDALFPSRCLVCGSFFQHDSNPNSALTAEVLRGGAIPDIERMMAPLLCPVCSRGFVRVESPMCSVCGIMFKSRAGEDHICGECLASPKRFKMARSLGVYERMLLKVIHRMKYGGKVQAARPVGTLLFFALIRYWATGTIDLVIPVPLHARKMRMRGFNQSFLLVRSWGAIAEALKIKLPHITVDRSILFRKRWTEPQTGLGRKKRLTNIRNAFGVCDPTKIAGKRILLVDDVYTTGATVNECAKTLLDAGAQRVDVLTLAQAT